jgi:hypothetical protein
MPRMTYKGEGYHNALDEEVEELCKAGWTVVTDADWAGVIAKKLAGRIQPPPTTLPPRSTLVRSPLPSQVK